MKLGVLFPQTEIGTDPGAIREFAQTADQLGFDHLLTYEHVVGAVPEGRGADWLGPYTVKDAFHEPFVLFGFLASSTSRIQLGTGMLNLPQRQTVLVAKQAAEVDLLSSGRLRLGIGLGWNTVECEAMGADFASRGERVEEQIAVLRMLWTQESVSFVGRWHRISGAGLNPRPIQKPIPIWMAGESVAAIKRAGRLADGWFPGGGIITEHHLHPGRWVGNWAAGVDMMREEAKAAGRDPVSIGINAWVHLESRPNPDAWVKWAEHWRQLGATHLTFSTMRHEPGVEPRPLSMHIEAIRRFKEAMTG